MTISKANKILIVDDDKQTLIDLIDILDSEYVIYTARDGMSALEKVNEVLPDLIMLDVIMPHLSGLDVFMELRNSYNTKDIPIILITAAIGNSLEYTGLSFGAVDYIRKPFDINITKLRVRHQITLLDLRRELEYVINKANINSQFKSTAVTAMNYGIQNPVSDIVKFAELALKDDISKKAKNYIKFIYDSAVELSSLIDTYLQDLPD